MATTQLDVHGIETAASRRFRTRSAGASLVLASLLIVAGELTTPPGASDGGVEAVDSFVAHPGLTQLSAVLFHFGYLLVLPGLVGLLTLTERRTPWLGRIGIGLGFVGFASLAGNLMLDLVTLGAARELGSEAALDAISRSDELPGVLPFVIPAFLGSFLGLLLVVVALARAGELEWLWVAVAVVGIALVVAAPLHLVTVAGFAAISAVLAVAGARLWRDG